jgi:transposase-like protein
LVAGRRFAREIILLAVRYYLQLGVAAERIAGILTDRGVDVSGRTILRWVQKFGPALSEEIRRHRKLVSTTWLVDETYVKILGAPRSAWRERSERRNPARSVRCGYGDRRHDPRQIAV